MKETALSQPRRARPSSAPRIGAALAPHSIYTVSEGLLRWTAEQAAERGAAGPHPPLRDRAGGRGLRRASTACGPAAYLDRLGVLNERTILAHGVWLDEEELALIAERGCTVVTNPVANMKLAVGGVFPYPAARECRRRRRPRHRRRRLERLARPLLRPQGLRPRPAPRQRRPDRPARREAWRIATGAASRSARGAHRSRSGRAGGLPAAAAELARAQPRRPPLRPGLRGERLGRRHHGRRRPGADARRRGRRAAEEVVARAVERSRRLGIGLTRASLIPPGVCYGEPHGRRREHDPRRARSSPS